MSERSPNPFDAIFDEIRQIVRHEIEAVAIGKALQIECIKRRCNANDILEELIAEHSKSAKKKGGE